MRLDSEYHWDPARSEECLAFLQAVELLIAQAEVVPAPRTFRKAYTLNYQALLPDENLRFRVDVLEAAREQLGTIWVNGEEYAFTPELVRAARRLWDHWVELQHLVRGLAFDDVALKGLRDPLAGFDQAWASFEQVYIFELIGIEQQAKRYVLEAAVCEQRLAAGRQHPEFAEARHELFAAVLRINERGNVRRKGRTDLGLEILEACELVVARGDVMAPVARRAVESYELLRAWLRDVGHHMERVDPHLCRNGLLVDRLCAFEESWEACMRLLVDPGVRGSVQDFVAAVRARTEDDAELREGLAMYGEAALWSLAALLLVEAAHAPDAYASLLVQLAPDVDLERLAELYASLRADGVEHAQIQAGACGAPLAHEGWPTFLVALHERSIQVQRSYAEDWNQFVQAVCSALEEH